MTAETMKLDPTAVFTLQPQVALRDALSGIGVPSKWLQNEDVVSAQIAQQQQQQAAAQQIAMINSGAQTAQEVGKASQAIEGMA
jgi:hypothetical protein